MKAGKVVIYDRDKKEEVVEKVFGEKSLFFMHRDSLLAKVLVSIIRSTLFARIYGRIQETRFSRRNIRPAVEKYDIDTSEFVRGIDEFRTFNDFFTRELKKEKRPIAGDKKTAVTPCDAKYLAFESFSKDKPFCIKDEKYYLDSLLGDRELAKKYYDGSMVVIRLDPTDYHRFHFPTDCVPGPARIINGYLYPVNPYGLYKNLLLYTEDKRAVTVLESETFGKVLFVEIGATTVGSINQTYEPGRTYSRGDEKGYFSFGGSSIIVLFEKGTIQFDQDLLDMTEKDIEVKAKYGQSLGTAIS